MYVPAGRPLSTLAFYLLTRSKLVTWASINTTKLTTFLRTIDAGYSPNNPYHNARHAADVLQSMHVIVTRGGLAPGYVDRATLLACYLSAVVHDFEHRGRSNDFLINTQDDLAIRYNGKACCVG